MRPSRRLWKFLFLGALGVFVTLPLFAGPRLNPEIEPNNTTATATPIASAATVMQGNLSSGDVDFYSFPAVAGDRIFASTMTAFSAVAQDTVMDLIATDGSTVLETDDDNGTFGGFASSLAGVLIPSTGTYFLRVNNFGSQPIIPYRLFFQKRSGSPVAETEPNDGLAQAMPGSGFVSGTISTPVDVDSFSIALNDGDTVFLSLDLDPERDNVDLAAKLSFAAAGKPAFTVIETPAPGPDSTSLFMTVQSAGTYFVTVESNGGSFGTYQLNATVFAAANEGTGCATYAASNLPAAIPDPGSVTSTITVPGGGVVRDVDVTISLTHAAMPDLDATLTSPNGTTVGLFTNIGSPNFTAMDVTIDDEAAIPIGAFANVEGIGATPKLTFRLSWFDGEPAAGAWTLTIYDHNASASGTLNSWSIHLCNPDPPAQCAGGALPVTVFATNFEADNGSFTHSGTLDEWQYGLPTAAPIASCNSGVACWKTDLTGTYEDFSDQDLVSPQISLAGLVGPVIVEWAQKYQLESAAFDHFFVEARQAGVPSNAIRLFEHQGDDMVVTVGDPPTTIDEAAGWGIYNGRIDSLAGQNIELRFHLDSDESVNRSGAAIDDIKITACPPFTLQTPTNLQATASAQTVVALSWTASAGATAYDIERRSSDGGGYTPLATGVATNSYNDATALADHAYIYRVRATAPATTPTAFSVPDAATTFVFANDPVAVGDPIRALHITQLRTAANALRAASGLTAFAFTGPAVTSGALISKAHLDDLRTAVNEARTNAGIASFGFTDPTITAQTTLVRIAHINELRTALK